MSSSPKSPKQAIVVMELESTLHSDIKLVSAVVVGIDTFHRWRQAGKYGSFQPPLHVPSFTCQTNQPPSKNNVIHSRGGWSKHLNDAAENIPSN